MEIEKYGIKENDGYIDFDIIIKFKKAISISSEFKILRGQFDVDKNCLKNSATCSSIWIVGTIKLLDEIPLLERELKELISKCQVAESERIKHDKGLYNAVKLSLDRILLPYKKAERVESEDNK